MRCRVVRRILDTGFYMLMAAALMSSLCIFLTMYSTDIDPDSGGHAYRATFVRNGAKLKRLFTLHSTDHATAAAQVWNQSIHPGSVALVIAASIGNDGAREAEGRRE